MKIIPSKCQALINCAKTHSKTLTFNTLIKKRALFNHCVLPILIYFFAINITLAQSKIEDFQSDPKLVLEEIFRAAEEQDCSNLNKLCPSDKTNDGDTQYLCDIASSKQGIKEFISYFKNARITGAITYSSSDGIEMAKVPFWFNHPRGESRSNEIMNMVKIDDKWYLVSF